MPDTQPIDASETGYLGWTNPETWATALWLQNDTPDVLQAAQEAARRGPRALRAFAEQIACEPLRAAPCLAGDLLGWALERVNWDEVREALQ